GPSCVAMRCHSRGCNGKDPQAKNFEHTGPVAWISSIAAAWMNKYLPGEDERRPSFVFGYNAAGALMQVLKQAGNDLSRENIMRQAANLRDVDLPMLLPGIKVNTSLTDYYPVQQLQLVRFDGRRWVCFGDLVYDEYAVSFRPVKARGAKVTARIRSPRATNSTYAASEIQELRTAPMMPASAIMISTAGNPPSARAAAPPATPQLPPRNVQALTIPDPCPVCARESADSARRRAKA